MNKANSAVRKPLQLSAIGNVEAYSTVSVKSQVGGVLTRVHFNFREGQDVSRGALLFTIDPRPFYLLSQHSPLS
jgi:multidrug efflux system membrane fusion protein